MFKRKSLQSAMTTIQPGNTGTIEGMTIRNNGTTAAKIMVTDGRYMIVSTKNTLLEIVTV